MQTGAQPGNTNARGKILTDALKRALARSGDGDVHKGANLVAQKAVDAALAGEMWAIREIWDRLEGKPTQTIGGDPDAPILTKGIVEFVRP